MSEEIFFGVARGFGGSVSAKITTDGKRLTSVKLKGEYETADIGGKILPELEAAFLEANSCEVDVVSGATLTWSGARYALRAAMEAAGLISSDTDGQKENLSTELLVIGCGPAGICAAMAAADMGVRVLMVDATESFGGNGQWSDGGFFVGTDEQKAAGIEYTVQQAFRDGMYWANYLNDPIIMRKWLTECAYTCRWANARGAGLKLLPYQKMIAHEDKPLTYHSWKGNDPIGHFRSYLDSKENVRIMLGTKCTELIRREDGMITGARGVKLNGTEVSITAVSVIVCCGGFISNPVMVERAVGEELFKYMVTDATTYNDGSGLKMAWAVGAQERDAAILEFRGGRTGLGAGTDGLPGCDRLMNLPILWVNKSGRRFMNEETVYEQLFFSNSLKAQGGYAYIVFDQASIDLWKRETIPLRMSFWDRFGADGTQYCPAVKSFEADFLTARRNGLGFVADSLDGLAVSMGVDPRQFKKTVAAYNAYVSSGVDEEFFKTAESLKYPVQQGPFYAIRCNLQAQWTVGGIRVNDSMQVLDSNERAIPGLYSAGADAGGLFDNSSSVMEGVCLSWSLVSGRCGGENAAEYIIAHR